MCIVAPLTPCGQVTVPVIFGIMIDVSNRQNYLAAGNRVRLVVFGPAVRVCRGSLTPVTGPLQDAGPYLRFPGGRV